VSKAFTDEETAESSVVGRPVSRAQRGRERPITSEGYRALVDEVRRLRETGSPGEADRALFEHRLHELEATLESVRVVEPPQSSDGVVRFGSRVQVRWDDGRAQAVRLVGPDEADASRGAVSIESPLAKAVLGSSRGDRVELELPGGLRSVEVLSVDS